MEIMTFLKDTRFGEKVQIDKMFETPFSKEIRICMAELLSGDMIYFDANVPHSLEAYEESVIRLTLSKNDSAKRVFSLAGA